MCSHRMDIEKVPVRLCNESTILAAQSQPVKDPPSISRCLPRPFYFHCLSGATRRGGSGTDPDDDPVDPQVGLSVTLTGSAMFIGLMVGGVLADRYERKK